MQVRHVVQRVFCRVSVAYRGHERTAAWPQPAARFGFGTAACDFTSNAGGRVRGPAPRGHHNP
jgi:hypothetical protein